MLEQRIQQQFFDGADLLYQSAEPLSKAIAEAASAIVGCITAGGKLLVAAEPAAAVLATHLVARLVGQFERDRPGLAAVWLDGAAASVGQLGVEGASAVTRQVETLGQPGDVLVVFASGAAPSVSALAPAAIAAAHAREMTVIALAGPGLPPEPLFETDVQVSIPADRLVRVLEVQLLAVHCLCDAIDLQLLGEQEDA